MEKELYYYLRDKDGHPRITVCLLLAGNGMVHRGIAIAGPFEKTITKTHAITGMKVTPRELAYHRALRAQKKQVDTLPVLRLEALWALKHVNNDTPYASFYAKSQYNKDMTEFEMKLFKGGENGRQDNS